MKTISARKFRAIRPRRIGNVCALWLAIAVAPLLAAPAQGCPDCALGREARREAWADDFALELLATALPFVVIGAVCVRVERR
jgi:hypothetical protein